MNKYSSCCGVFMNGQYQDYQRCPACKESCDAVSSEDETETKEFTTVKIETFKWDAIKTTCHLTHGKDYEVKAIEVVDGLFKDDNIYKAYKKASLKAYKDLKDYEFKTRHNIK